MIKKKAKKPLYFNQPCSILIKGSREKFDSKLELSHYMYLADCQRKGIIRNLERQKSFDIITIDIYNPSKSIVIGTHRIDFAFVYNKDKKDHYWESKGFDHEDGKLRRRIVEACYNIKIELITAKKIPRL